MATIYIGHVTGGALPLAIKKLNVHGSSPELVTMFLDELAPRRPREAPQHRADHSRW